MIRCGRSLSRHNAMILSLSLCRYHLSPLTEISQVVNIDIHIFAALESLRSLRTAWPLRPSHSRASRPRYFVSDPHESFAKLIPAFASQFDAPKVIFRCHLHARVSSAHRANCKQKPSLTRTSCASPVPARMACNFGCCLNFASNTSSIFLADDSVNQ